MHRQKPQLRIKSQDPEAATPPRDTLRGYTLFARRTFRPENVNHPVANSLNITQHRTKMSKITHFPDYCSEERKKEKKYISDI